MPIYFHGNVGNIITNHGVIEIRNGKIYQDGKEITTIPTNHQEITINIQGDLERLEVQHCERIKVTGNVRRVKTNHGDIEIGGNVEGDAHTNMGDITCKNVEGDARTNMGNIYKTR